MLHLDLGGDQAGHRLLCPIGADPSVEVLDVLADGLLIAEFYKGFFEPLAFATEQHHDGKQSVPVDVTILETLRDPPVRVMVIGQAQRHAGPGEVVEVSPGDRFFDRGVDTGEVR